MLALLILLALMFIPTSVCSTPSDTYTGGLNNSSQNIDIGANYEGLSVVVANTTYGRVAGLRSDNELNVFLGIPYARAPVGPLRFEPPQEPRSWNGILPAFTFGPVCPQTQSSFVPSSYYPQSEDCLSLNVWTPGIDNKRRPVLVFIHGGAFISGASAESTYNGSSLACNGDIVCVTINYRLGALGFLYLGQQDSKFAKSGNLGLLDQIFALKWVQNNIEGFGGDPENVTVMGESAGSISVTTLMSAPAARGLFHRAIAESGAPNLCLSRDVAANVTKKLMKLANVADIRGLRNLTAFQLIGAQERLLKESGLSASNTFAPVIDGQVIPEDPFLSLENGSAEGIPLLLGTNKNEFRLWLLYDPILSYIPPAALLAIYPNSEEVFGNRMAEILLRYRLNQPLAWPNDLTMEILTDSEFWIPQVRMVEIQSKHAPTWMYRFNWPSPFEGGRLGAYHGLELPFIFHNFNSPQAYLMVGLTPPLQLADRMQSAWIDFIRTGNPNTGDQPHWVSYNSSQRGVLIFNINSTVQYDPDREVRLLYKGTPVYP